MVQVSFYFENIIDKIKILYLLILICYRNDIVLTESHRIKMLEDNDGRSILRLDPATELDLGIYKVVARNKFGQTTARAR